MFIFRKEGKWPDFSALASDVALSGYRWNLVHVERLKRRTVQRVPSAPPTNKTFHRSRTPYPSVLTERRFSSRPCKGLIRWDAGRSFRAPLEGRRLKGIETALRPVVPSLNRGIVPSSTKPCSESK